MSTDKDELTILGEMLSTEQPSMAPLLVTIGVVSVLVFTVGFLLGWVLS